VLLIRGLAKRLTRSVAFRLRLLIRRLFPLFERLGYHVVPSDYESPVPDSRVLSRKTWSPSELPGVELNEAAQMARLARFAERYRDEYVAFPITDRHDGSYFLRNDMFGAVDAEILYCMLRDCRPKRVVEIGSGYSTRLIAQALLKNAEDGDAPVATFAAIDPHASAMLHAEIEGVSDVIGKPVEEAPLALFTELDANDIVFIDSSHVLKVGGDVQFEVCGILPRLRPGVVVHFHDIFLPADYPREWVVEEHRGYNEQYVLQAFLAFNEQYEVLWAGHFMHLFHSDLLESAFPSYSSCPVSFWIRRKGS
jgi:predicted O-methyltransferase YrrM